MDENNSIQLFEDRKIRTKGRMVFLRAGRCGGPV